MTGNGRTAAIESDRAIGRNGSLTTFLLKKPSLNTGIILTESMARFAPEPAPVLILMPGRFAMDYTENGPENLGDDCRPVALPA